MRRAKPGCLTSLIDALPRNLSPRRVNEVACDVLESEAVKAVLLQRQKRNEDRWMDGCRVYKEDGGRKRKY